MFGFRRTPSRILPLATSLCFLTLRLGVSGELDPRGRAFPEIRVGGGESSVTSDLLVLPDGEMVVSFSQPFWGHFFQEVYIQFVDPDGGKVGERIVVDPYRRNVYPLSDGAGAPFLGGDGEGNFLAMWCRGEGSSHLMVGGFDGFGERLSDPVEVVRAAGRTPKEGPCNFWHSPALSRTGHGGFLVTWRGARCVDWDLVKENSGCIWIRKYDLFGQVLEETFFGGGWLGPDYEILGRSVYPIAITSVPGGESFLLYEEIDEYFQGSRTDVRYHYKTLRIQRYSPALEPIGDPVEIRRQYWTIERARIASDARGDFVVVWMDNVCDGRCVPGDLSLNQVLWAQVFDRSGEPLVDPILIDSQFRLSGPRVDMDSEGNFVVAWGGRGPNGARFDRLGNRLGPSFRINAMAGGRGGYDVDLTDDGRFAVLHGRYLRVLDFHAPTFIRGDFNGDGTIDLADAIAILECLFLGVQTPNVLDAGDIDDDERILLGDPILLLQHLFQGNPSTLPHPWPWYGFDATP